MGGPSRTRGVVATVVTALLLAVTLPAAAASWEAKLLAADGLNSDFFGEAVAVSGDTIVVGAKLQNAGGFDRGAAYVLVRTGTRWVQQAKLTATDAQNSDHFGSSVAIAGDTVVVGARSDDDRGTSSGSAYVFSRSAGVWTQTAKLTAPDGAAGDEFGSAVATSGRTVLVGVHRDDDATGSVHVFLEEGTGWQHETRLVATDRQRGDLFGHALALSDGTALISAHGDDDRATDAGAAYFFTRTGGQWTQDAKVTAPDGASGDVFGFSVSLSGDTALLSAFADDDGARDAGSAYVLRRVDGRWEHEVKLRASDPAEGDVFGRAVALDGGGALIGAPMDDTVGVNTGAAYAFERRGGRWVQTAKLTAPEPGETDLLGYSVAMDGAVGVVGEPLDDERGTSAGSAHVFTGLADVVPPAISAEVTPAPNDAGWHDDVPVVVTFTCSDEGSGIADCTAPAELSTEPGAVVTGHAVDQAGNAATMDVAVRIDMAPPLVTIDDPSPLPGVPFPAGAISGTAIDALSGVDQVRVTFSHEVTGTTETREAVRNGDVWTVSTRGLTPGPTAITVTATDLARNIGREHTLVIITPS